MKKLSIKPHEMSSLVTKDLSDLVMKSQIHRIME